MEIFGLVWAASIMTSPPLEKNQRVGRVPQKQSAVAFESFALDRMASGLKRGFESDSWKDWDFPSDPSLVSELLTRLMETAIQAVPSFTAINRADPVAIALPFQGGGDEAAIGWIPAIGLGLHQGLGLATVPTLVPDSPIDLVVAMPAEVPPAPTPQWDEWAAVAAVRVELTSVGAVPDAGIHGLERRCMPVSSPELAAQPVILKATPKAQIWVQDQFIGEVVGLVAAQRIAEQLRALLQSGTLDAEALKPVFSEKVVGIHYQDELVMVVNENLRSHPEVSATEIAVQWVNNLRVALDAPPLDWGEVHMAATGLQPTAKTLKGTASWYGPGFHGRKTANGERYDQNSLTAAHKTLPFNTYLKVTNRLNGKSVVVRINDRGPYVGKRSLDLSKAAADCLGSVHKGVVPYDAVILKSTPLPALDTETTVSFKPE